METFLSENSLLINLLLRALSALICVDSHKSWAGWRPHRLEKALPIHSFIREFILLKVAWCTVRISLLGTFLESRLAALSRQHTTRLIIRRATCLWWSNLSCSFGRANFYFIYVGRISWAIDVRFFLLTFLIQICVLLVFFGHLLRVVGRSKENGPSLLCQVLVILWLGRLLLSWCFGLLLWFASFVALSFVLTCGIALKVGTQG